MSYCTSYLSPLGHMTLAGSSKGLAGLWFEGQKYFLGTLNKQKLHNAPELPVFKLACSWLNRYFSGLCPSPNELSLMPEGSSFRQQVWKMLCAIPYGSTVTYGTLAKQITDTTGRPMSAQAVGGAVAHNPLSIIIPCHRVVGSSGCLTGYAGGITIKKALLELEGVDISRFTTPY